MTLNWNSGELADGLACYRREKFFEAHEHWEAVWLRSPEPEKTFLQALIQITAAFHHLQRNNVTGAKSLLRAALRRLQPCPPFFGGIAVHSLREDVIAWLRLLEAEIPSTRGRLPRIAPELSASEVEVA